MDQSIIEKLKKLLRLGQSGNQHEAELAVERAFELAAKHNIDLASVDVDEETRRILHKRFRMGKRLSLIRKLVIQLVHKFFNVNAVLARPDVVLVGTETDVEIANYVMEFLIRACTRSLAAFSREQTRKLSLTKRKSFIAGFMYGVGTKLNASKKTFQIEEAKNALVLASEAARKKYVADNFKTINEPIDMGRRNADAMTEGYVAGKNTEISKAVDGKRTEGRLLTA
jgi:hypothetical protein